MANRSSARNQSTTSFVLVNVDFSYEERDAVNTWLENRTLVLSDFLLELIETGFKFSVSNDLRTDALTISLTDKRQIKGRSKNPVYMIRHADFEKIFGVAWYFWTVVLAKGDNGSYEPGSDMNW